MQMPAERDVGTQVDSFHGAVCPIQGYAAATLMDFCVCWGGRRCLTQETYYQHTCASVGKSILSLKLQTLIGPLKQLTYKLGPVYYNINLLLGVQKLFTCKTTLAVGKYKIKGISSLEECTIRERKA